MVQIWAYNENEFIISGDILEVDQKREDFRLRVSINPVLKYKDKIDVVGCQMTIAYSLGDKQVLHYSAIISIMIEGWKHFLKGNPQDQEKIEFTKEAWIEALGFVRGVIYAKSQSQGHKVLAGHLLPPIEIDRFMEAIKIERVE